jgi:uncharacterized protein (DUF2225 family)
MSQLYVRKIKCPVCHHEFSTTKVKLSGIKLIRRDEDFCGYYALDNPVFYGVYVCPTCGYSAFESDFLTINEMKKIIVKNRITPKWTQQDYGGERSLDDALTVHQLCLYCYHTIGQKKSDVAKVCLRLAWLYRMLGNEEKEKHFLTFARDNYDRAHSDKDFEQDPENEVLICYLLGELNRRLGEYKDGVYWYQEALKLPQIKKKRNILDLTREQLFVCKNQYKKMMKEQMEEEK